MKNYLSSFLSVLWCVFIISACSPDENSLDDILDDIEDGQAQSATATISAKVNGNDFASSGVFVTSVLNSMGNGSYNLVIGAGRLSNGVDEAIALGMVSTDFNTLSAGDTFAGGETESLMVDSYGLDDDGANDFTASSEPLNTNIVTITSIDHDAKLISGTFSFDAIDDETEVVYEVREGVFTDIGFDDSQL